MGDKKLKPFGEIPESFQGLIDKGIYYTDKTGFIPYLIEQNRNICVFTRPRRFGKTLMLRTLQTFFEYRLDDKGKPVDNRRYFEGLKVMDAGEDVLKHLGQYPVISLSFKDVSGDSYEEIVGQLRGTVCEACDPHEKILKESRILSEEQLKILQSYLDGNASDGNLRLFLKYLPLWLFKVTHKKVVILLDEYDVPLQKEAIYDMHHPECELFDRTVKLIGGFISSGFKSNSNLAYGIIAGCMRVAKESIFTGMNNPGVITVVDEIPDEFWGFTQKEVEKMLDYYDLSDKMDALKHWY
ncbi:MAG: AAA family ATPase, partial [Proteobacteria bacterium]|nr:AAA family ATPase [Pseudomonadota bacterium]